MNFPTLFIFRVSEPIIPNLGCDRLFFPFDPRRMSSDRKWSSDECQHQRQTRHPHYPNHSRFEAAVRNLLTSPTPLPVPQLSPQPPLETHDERGSGLSPGGGQNKSEERALHFPCFLTLENAHYRVGNGLLVYDDRPQPPSIAPSQPTDAVLQ